MYEKITRLFLCLCENRPADVAMEKSQKRRPLLSSKHILVYPESIKITKSTEKYNFLLTLKLVNYELVC